LVIGRPCRPPREQGMNAPRAPPAHQAAHTPAELTRAKAMAQTVREKARIRQARDDGRPSEDDVAQDRLGWGGQKGRPRTTMTEESKKETSPALDPGHTA